MDLDAHTVIIQLISNNFPGFGETITSKTDIQNQLGLDSLGIATLVAELTSDFDIDLQYFAEHIGEIHTVGDLVNVFSSATSPVD